MSALVQAISRRWTWTETNTKIKGTDILTLVALSCGAGLFVSLMFAAYGLDLSPGFF